MAQYSLQCSSRVRRPLFDPVGWRSSACCRRGIRTHANPLVSGQSEFGHHRTVQIGTDTVRTILANGCDQKAIRSDCNRNCAAVLGQPAPLSVEWETPHAPFARQPARSGQPPTTRLVLRGRARSTPG